jgi:hypothetical protein
MLRLFRSFLELTCRRTPAPIMFGARINGFARYSQRPVDFPVLDDTLVMFAKVEQVDEDSGIR